MGKEKHQELGLINLALTYYTMACSSADPSLFVYHSDQGTLTLLLYVDDIILTGSSSKLIHDFINQLHVEFAMKDLGTLHYFLWIQVSSILSGLFLKQRMLLRSWREAACTSPNQSRHQCVQKHNQMQHHPCTLIHIHIDHWLGLYNI